MITHHREFNYTNPATGETTLIGTEDIRWSEGLGYGKYNNGMANFLDYVGDSDEATGDVEWAEYVQRFGKRLLFSDDRGFVTVERFENEAAAKARFDEIDAAYCEWLEANDENGY